MTVDFVCPVSSAHTLPPKNGTTVVVDQDNNDFAAVFYIILLYVGHVHRPLQRCREIR